MTQVAHRESILAPIDGVPLEYDGVRHDLQFRGSELWVDSQPTGKHGNSQTHHLGSRKVVLTTGSHHIQTYWLASGEGRKLWLFPLAYHLAEARWMPLDSVFVLPPGTRQELYTGLWNENCNRCHATGVMPRLDGTESGHMDTLVAEMGIACEACHGPSKQHAVRNRDPWRRYAQHIGDGSDAQQVVHPGELDPVRGSEVCGQCHGLMVQPKRERQEWRRTGSRYKPGDSLADMRILLTDGDQWFWPDGMVRVSGREYNGLVRSPCFAHGDPSRGILTCFHCHEMHPDPDSTSSLVHWANDQLRSGMDGNAACTGCHTAYLEVEELERHSHHRKDGPGSSCMNCHMPNTSYGLLKATRSHEINSPSVGETLDTGRPNACNLCHLDKSLGWAASWLSQWYGSSRDRGDRGGRAMSSDEQTVSAAILWLLSGDAGQRALAACALSSEEARRTSGTEWMPAILAHLLEDPYDAVRFISGRSLRKDPLFAALEYDFLGPIHERRVIKQTVLREWAHARRQLGNNPALLMKDGVLDLDAVVRLISNRDERPVTLTE